MESFVSMSGRSRKQPEPLMRQSHFEAGNPHSTISNGASEFQGASHDMQPGLSTIEAVLPSYHDESLQEGDGAGGHELEGYGEVMDIRQFLIWGGFRR